jgi:cytochrome c-type biogenesis protein CcmH
MGMFWIVAAAMSLGVSALLLKGLMGKSQSDTDVPTNPDMSIYKSQMQELDRDEVSGAIGVEEAKSARAEISRRLLAAGDEDQMTSSGLSSRQRIAVLVLVCLIMPSLAALIYIQKGSPNYAAQPYTDRNGEAELWVNYGRAYMQTERFEDAEGAFQQAIELSGPRADLYESLGEAIVFGGDGSISPRAARAFTKALELDPARERSRYILAEWAWRQGEREEAVRAFVDLLEDTDDASLQAFLKERIDGALAQIKAELSGEPGTERPSVPPAGLADPGVRPQPRPLSGMSEDQRTRVLQMVAGLAQRLEGEPDNLEGWLRLIRSYTVLQEDEKARSALQTATLQFLTQSEAMSNILALAAELDLAKGPQLPEGAEGIVLP